MCGWSFPEAARTVGELLHVQSVHTINSEQQQVDRQKVIREQAEKRRKTSEIKARQETREKDALCQQRAIYAYQEWCAALPADPNHSYLKNHCLPALNLKQMQHPVYGDCLLVPLMNEQGLLMNLERINPEGMKRPIKGARKKGCFYQFGSDSFTVYIAESWSTGAAIHLNKSCRPVVLAAMSASNLDAVAAIAKQRFSESNIVVAADNDKPGIDAAIKVANHYDLKIILPSKEGNDFCDLHIDNVRERSP